MKILIYCQHVLGVGHFFRTLEIVRALKGHQAVLVTGGPPVEAQLPTGVKEVRLPGLAMDSNFSGLHPTDENADLEDVKRQRAELFYSVFEKERPDVFLVELYPFGRKAFGFELKPVLEGISSGNSPSCKVVCSLRDVLVEKKDPPAYEKRVASILNTYFHGLAVHADPALISLEETFSSMDRLSVPVKYTGFVAPKPGPGAREAKRRELGLSDDQKLILVSAGGGKVGFPLVSSAIGAFESGGCGACIMHVFSGPFMDEKEYAQLKMRESKKIKVERFTDDFLAYLAAADLSVSMAGYNTSMNVLAANVPAIALPFMQNREQSLRARRLAEFGAVRVISENDFDPAKLWSIMEKTMSAVRRGAPPVDLEGASNTAAWLETLAKQG